MGGVLLSLALLLGVLAVSGGVLRRLGQSAIPAYILLGVATRSTVADPHVIEFVQALGIALLLFFVGLEFSILRLRRGFRRYLTAGGIDLAVNFPVGLAGGLLLGWGWPASFLLGATLYISSSAIVAQNITDLGRAAYPETELALAVLVAEDLVIGVFLALMALWPPFSAAGVSVWATAGAVAAMVLLLTLLSGPATRAFDRIFRGADDEVVLLGISGLILLFAGGSLAAGLSEALGAFVAGLLVGDTGLKERVERLLTPFRGLFAALFFFAFGLTVEASSLPPALVPGLALAAAALLAKVAGGVAVGRAAGLSPAARVNLGVTLSPRGEFSVLLASYGAVLGVEALEATVAVVVLTLAVAGTLLTQAGPGLGARVAGLFSRTGDGETA